MSKNIRIRLTPEEKAELEHLAEAHRDAQRGAAVLAGSRYTATPVVPRIEPRGILGSDPARPTAETRLIAINEGKLVDFLSQHRQSFPHLSRVVETGLRTSEPHDGVLVVQTQLGVVTAGEVCPRSSLRNVSPTLLANTEPV